MKGLRFIAMLLTMVVCSVHVWSYRITDNYTIESKFKINALGAGIAFRASAISGSNDLLGTTEPLTTSGSEYVLAKPEGEPVGFYLVEAGKKIPAGKAYLTSASGVKGFIFNGSGATGIDAVNAAQGKENGYIYNVSGQRLQKTVKGINIVAGKKILK